MKVELDLPNYATKTNLRNTGVNTSSFDRNVDLANLKFDVKKIRYSYIEKSTN